MTEDKYLRDKDLIHMCSHFLKEGNTNMLIMLIENNPQFDYTFLDHSLLRDAGYNNNQVLFTFLLDRMTVTIPDDVVKFLIKWGCMRSRILILRDLFFYIRDSDGKYAGFLYEKIGHMTSDFKKRISMNYRLSRKL